ncbi:RNA ligase RtcB family protein [Neptuniibacter caesariensis]|uniref:3'-phosphate/5'-hydroxy nucleic acid ligase n=1 Tax=Neptuniibacter caesariensis TaxID=207954 RepID=A0A7U8C8T8_NEPCE|nr:RNA ligase RtcB family protein [Neptuniibacter caesariensis]EAR61909.1 hypothetical protein MED92_03138 [Oceanospirillum sp. MED92] [Neptuniibacter caesariensis]
MGNSVQKITDKVTLIASERTWIEGVATEQLIKTSELDSMLKVVGMPDLHAGRGYPIGAAFLTSNKIYPALVGNDIGCGMSLWQTSAELRKLNVQKWIKKLNDVESPLGSAWQDEITERKQQKQVTNAAFDQAFGTIGGGNHFAEFQVIDQVEDSAKLAALGIDAKKVLLLVHSGSRGLGQKILTEHISFFNHQGLLAETQAFHDYLTAHNEALRWAELNREFIAKRFLKAIRESGELILDINHNLVSKTECGGEPAWLHRKGSTPADQGAVIIPGSRGDYSYLVQPTASTDEVSSGLDESLHSLAHGAGRKWKRGDCQQRLSSKYKKQDLLKTELGSRVICNNKELLYDEAPQAYKDCETIIDDLCDAGLVRVIARLRPALTFKTNGDCS